MKSKILSLLIAFSLLGTVFVKADIFNPITPENKKLTATIPTAFNSGTVLTDVTQVINYLGIKEGYAYNFNKKKWVTTTGATLVSLPFNFSIGVSMLNADGVTGNIEWNLGNYLPVQQVPIMKYVQYLYVFGGAGIENDSNDNTKFASVVGVEEKFSF